MTPTSRRAKRAPALLLTALVLGACAAAPEEVGIPLTPEEQEYQRRLAGTEPAALDDEGRARLILDIDRSLSTWFRANVEHAGSTDRQRVDELEEVLRRTVYRNFDAVLGIYANGDRDQRLVAAAALGFSRLPEPADPAARAAFLERWPRLYPRALAPLGAGLAEDDSLLARNCLLALWKIGAEETPLEPVLRQLHSTDEDVRSNAALALSTILTPETGERAIHPLLLALSDPAPKVRNHAVTAIARIRHPDAAGRLAQLLDDPYLLIQANAAEALAAIGDAGNAGHLVDRLERLLADRPSGKFRKKTGLDHGRDRVLASLVDALTRLSGESFGEDGARWREWWNERRRAA